MKTLRDTDTFNIVSFAGEDHLMQSGLISLQDILKAIFGEVRL